MSNFKKNKAFSGIFTIGVGNIVGGVITSFFWLFLAGILDTESYGQLSYFLAIMGITSVAASFGGAFTMQVYVSKGLKIEAVLYFISIITSLIGAIILFFMFEDIGLSLLVIGTSVLNLYLVELLGKKLFSKHSKIYIVQKLLFVALSLLFYFTIGFEGILIGFALSNFVFIKHVINILRKEKLNFNIKVMAGASNVRSLTWDTLGYHQNIFEIGGEGTLRGYDWKGLSSSHYQLTTLEAWFGSVGVFYDRAILFDSPGNVFNSKFLKDLSDNMPQDAKSAIGFILGRKNLRLSFAKQMTDNNNATMYLTFGTPLQYW